MKLSKTKTEYSKQPCVYCKLSVLDIDPHYACKSCRQPDPQMFYCSDSDCDACKKIKLYKPLEITLQKQELETLTYKLMHKPGPASAKSKAGPISTKNKPGPAPKNSKPEPALTKNKPGPASTKNKPGPASTKNKPGPASTENKPGPASAKNKPGPASTKNKPGPASTKNKPGPASTKNKPGPASTENKPGPASTENKPGPALTKNKPGPASKKKWVDKELPKIQVPVSRSSSLVQTITIDDDENLDQLLSNTQINESPADKINLHDIESRIYNQILAKLHSSMSQQAPDIASSNNDSITNIEGNLSQPSISATIKNEFPNNGNVDLSEIFEDKMNILFKIFESGNPSLVLKSCKHDPSNQNLNTNYSLKISHGTTDILLNSTILSSPVLAERLVEKLDLPKDLSTWPALNATDLLHSDFNNIPAMKLHPKARHLHDFLFNTLKVSMPKSVLDNDLTLPEFSVELKNEFLFAREQLQRLIFMYSLIENYKSVQPLDESTGAEQLFDVLCYQMGISLEKQANFLGLLLRELRGDVLNNTQCKVKNALCNLVNGPIFRNQTFGPYVKELENIVSAKGKTYCIKPMITEINIKLFQLPNRLTNMKECKQFLAELEIYFEHSQTCEKDKITILKYLLPDMCSQKLVKLVNIEYLNCYESWSSSLGRIFGSESTNFMQNRLLFTNCKQEDNQNVTQFAEDLEKLNKDCSYGMQERELLRDQFIFGLINKDVQQSLLTEFFVSFEDALNYAKETEQILTEKKRFSLKEPISPTPDQSVSAPTESLLIDSCQNPVKTRNSKRKSSEVGELFSGFSPVKKKFKLKDNKFYGSFITMNTNEDDDFVQIKSISEWKDKFSLNTSAYVTYCPWTGRILRS